MAKVSNNYITDFFKELVSPARLASGVLIAICSLCAWIFSTIQNNASIEAKLDKYIALTEERNKTFEKEIDYIKAHINLATNEPKEPRQLSYNQAYAIQPHELKMEVDENWN